MRRASVLTFVTLIGCADHGAEGMFILNNTAPPTGTVCTLTSDVTQPYTTHGVIYAGSPQPYLLTPLIQSRLQSPVGQELVHTIHLEGADIILSAADSTGTLAEVARYTSLFCRKPWPACHRECIVLADLDRHTPVDPGHRDGHRVEREHHGVRYRGGGRIDAQPFDYPVTACVETNGACVVKDHGPCPLVSSTTNLGDPCNVFQDGVVDCCESGTSLVCPGTTM